MIEFWAKTETYWKKLADYLAKKNKMPWFFPPIV